MGPLFWSNCGFNNSPITLLAGQGTIGLEIMDQQPDIDILVVPVGGGGLISGIARAVKEINPRIKIIGVEPAKIPTMSLAVKGNRNMHPAVMTIAEGINVSILSFLLT